MKNRLFTSLIVVFILCLPQMRGISQTREVGLHLSAFPADGWILGGAMDYFIPVKERASVGVKMAYLTDRWNGFKSGSVIHFADISLLIKRRTSNRPKSRFFYEYGISLALFGEQYFATSPLYCGTGRPSVESLISMGYYPVQEGYTEFSFLAGGDFGLKYDRQIFKKTYIGVSFDFQYFYNFGYREGMCSIKPAISVGYEF